MTDDVPLQESCGDVLQYLESQGSELGLGNLVKIMWKGKDPEKNYFKRIFFCMSLLTIQIPKK